MMTRQAFNLQYQLPKLQSHGRCSEMNGFKHLKPTCMNPVARHGGTQRGSLFHTPERLIDYWVVNLAV